MNKKDLERLLVLNKVPKDLYSLNGGTPSETYCIEKRRGKYKVYYSERGVKSDIGLFETEQEACLCLLNEIKKIVRIL